MCSKFQNSRWHIAPFPMFTVRTTLGMTFANIKLIMQTQNFEIRGCIGMDQGSMMEQKELVGLQGRRISFRKHGLQRLLALCL